MTDSGAQPGLSPALRAAALLYCTLALVLWLSSVLFGAPVGALALSSSGPSPAVSIQFHVLLLAHPLHSLKTDRPQHGTKKHSGAESFPSARWRGVREARAGEKAKGPSSLRSCLSVRWGFFLASSAARSAQRPSRCVGHLARRHAFFKV